NCGMQCGDLDDRAGFFCWDWSCVLVYGVENEMPVVGADAIAASDPFVYINVERECLTMAAAGDGELPPELEKCALHADAQKSHRVGRVFCLLRAAKPEGVVACDLNGYAAAIIADFEATIVEFNAHPQAFETTVGSKPVGSVHAVIDKIDYGARELHVTRQHK